jgi:DNA repair protein RecO (recombination protein O)
MPTQPSSSQSTRALLLRSVDYAEADRVVTLLSERFGRVSAMARGARRSQKRFGGALSPLCVLSVELRPGRGELWTLTGARIEVPCLRLLSDLPRMNAGFSGLELLRSLTPEHEPDPERFALGAQLLRQLEQGQASGEALLACFGVRLLSLAGMAPRLDRCARCGRVPRPDQAATLDASEGGLVCRQCGGAPIRVSPALRQRLLRALSSEWVEAAGEALDATDLGSVRRLLDASVEARVGKSPHREANR